MNTKRIESREDVDFLVRRFYEQVRTHGQLGPIFNEIVQDWEIHLTHLSDFWEMILLQTGPGAGKFNPTRIHREVDEKVNYSIDQVHFENWLELWHATINHYFQGDVASYAKEHARRMAQMLFIRILEVRPVK